jgi:hypothetical protein
MYAYIKQASTGLERRTGRATTGGKCFDETVLLSQKRDMVCRTCCVVIHVLLDPCAGEYKPILEEVERILADAGLDEEDIKRSAAIGGSAGVGLSRNRR